MGKVSPKVGRGRIKEITLKRQITFDGNTIKRAVIEIDHINYGLDPKTKGLKRKKRTNFTVNDIEKFLVMLDGDYVAAREFRG